MSTILPSAPRLATVPVLPPQAARPAEGHYFSAQVEGELAQADHDAWSAVCTILLAIVALGLIIGIGAVLMII